MLQQTWGFHDHRVTRGEVAHVRLHGWLVRPVDSQFCVLHRGGIHCRRTHLLLLLVRLAELRVMLACTIELNLGLLKRCRYLVQLVFELRLRSISSKAVNFCLESLGRMLWSFTSWLDLAMKHLEHLRLLMAPRLLLFIHFIDAELMTQVCVAVRRATLWIELV